MFFIIVVAHRVVDNGGYQGGRAAQAAMPLPPLNNSPISEANGFTGEGWRWGGKKLEPTLGLGFGIWGLVQEFSASSAH